MISPIKTYFKNIIKKQNEAKLAKLHLALKCLLMAPIYDRGSDYEDQMSFQSRVNYLDREISKTLSKLA